jgi:hypothetical protein
MPDMPGEQLAGFVQLVGVVLVEDQKYRREKLNREQFL